MSEDLKNYECLNSITGLITNSVFLNGNEKNCEVQQKAGEAKALIEPRQQGQT